MVDFLLVRREMMVFEKLARYSISFAICSYSQAFSIQGQDFHC